jgi:hypothetical protein
VGLPDARRRATALVAAVWLATVHAVADAGSSSGPASPNTHVTADPVLPAGSRPRAEGSRLEDPVVSTAASDAEALGRFVSRPDEPTRAYRAQRRLEVTSGALGKKAWMDVLVEVDPQNGFRCRILAAGGSELLQERILRKVLRAEQEVYASGGTSTTALTADNYSLAPGGRDARGLVRLLATARRKEVGLLNGQFLVTPDTADLVEVSGTMAKGPSFWIPRVDMTKRYARVHGHRVDVQVDSVSQVRLLGELRFTMTTEYESIDGDSVIRVGTLGTGAP